MRRNLNKTSPRSGAKANGIEMKKILFLIAHPNLKLSKANRAILEAVGTLPNLTVNDLYETYPHFFIDVEREKNLLLQHDLIVYQHPFYWYNKPALLRQWEDDVLQLGFAYGPGGDKLKGKQFLLSITAGGPMEAYAPSGYNNFPIEALLAPTIQTAALCGWQWLPHIVLHSSASVPTDRLNAHAEHVRDRLLQIANPSFSPGAVL